MNQTAGKIRDFTDLEAWKKGHSLVLGVYGATKSFPASEQFSLTAQLRRAAVSVTSNISEGFSRQSKADKIHFYHMSLGSCSEVQNQLIIAHDLNYVSEAEYKKLVQLCITTHKLLNGLVKAIRNSA